jgi:hypothetical protein
LLPELNKHAGFLWKTCNMSLARLAMDMEDLASDIASLVKADSLRRRDDGTVYDARMVADYSEEGRVDWTSVLTCEPPGRFLARRSRITN